MPTTRYERCKANHSVKPHLEQMWVDVMIVVHMCMHAWVVARSMREQPTIRSIQIQITLMMKDADNMRSSENIVQTR
jgi:hypothetical protein